MLATEIFRKEPPPPLVNEDSVASMLPVTVVLGLSSACGVTVVLAYK